MRNLSKVVIGNRRNRISLRFTPYGPRGSDCPRWMTDKHMFQAAAFQSSDSGRKQFSDNDDVYDESNNGDMDNELDDENDDEFEDEDDDDDDDDEDDDYDHDDEDYDNNDGDIDDNNDKEFDEDDHHDDDDDHHDDEDDHHHDDDDHHHDNALHSRKRRLYLYYNVCKHNGLHIAGDVRKCFRASRCDIIVTHLSGSQVEVNRELDFRVPVRPDCHR
ncbi:protein PFC0760c-like [Gigantopelta aegis]|uniref:protein PFC0760c-like n=1 Tax=Gigantopelta aegis TaxID=1735272 RepID=UPI001B88B130|nr:protein PFC0760c-like [Gigantopelta aegis]